MDTYDVLIVGGGMAGCILATRIAEHGIHPETGERLKVAMVERGPYFKGDPKPGYGIPLRRKMFTNITREFREGGRYSMGLFSSRYDVMTGNVDRSGTGTADVASIVGGGSLHWGAITQVPEDVDYQIWAQETGVDWTADEYRSAGEEIRTLFNIHPRPETLLTKGDFLFREAARSLGYAVRERTVAKKNCILCGFCNSADMCKYDAKMGPLITHLPLAESIGVQIIPDAEVGKIVLEKEGGRVVAKGILYRLNGRTESAAAEKIIVSCGTFGTPPLLFRSGYGRRDVLGSNLIVENPNIGENIDAKPSMGSVTGVFDEALSSGDYRDGGFSLDQDVDSRGYADRLQITFSSQRLNTAPELLALHPLAPQLGKEHKEFMQEIYNPTASSNPRRMALLRRGSVGATVIRPSQVRGRIDANGRFQYDLNHPSILKRFQEAREIAVELLRQVGAREILNANRPLRVSRATMQVSSCRAGRDASTSVVNSDFESHDVDNLFICDGSVLPRKASNGYGAPVATVATYAAQRIVAKHFSARN